jgi:hypothetical protein
MKILVKRTALPNDGRVHLFVGSLGELTEVADGFDRFVIADDLTYDCSGTRLLYRKPNGVFDVYPRIEDYRFEFHVAMEWSDPLPEWAEWWEDVDEIHCERCYHFNKKDDGVSPGCDHPDGYKQCIEEAPARVVLRNWKARKA